MSWIVGLRARLRSMMHRRAAEERMDEEIRFHVDMQTEANLRAGMSPAEAHRQARIALGALESHREALRDGRRLPVLETLWRDLRYSARSFRKSPGFTVAAVLTLAIGVGANTAVFALVSASLLRPLPFEDADRLVTLYQRYTAPGEEGLAVPWSYPEFSAVRSNLRSISEIAAYHATDVNLAGTGTDPVRVGAEIVSAAYFRALAVQPVLGRTFQPAEDSVPGTHAVALLGHGLWRREFGSDPGVVSRTIVLNGVPLTVVGVLPEGFHGLTGDGEVWIPHAIAPRVYFPEHLTIPEQFLSVVARVRPGVSLARARAEAASVAARVAADVRGELGVEPGEGRWEAALLPLEEARRDPGTVRAQLALAGAVLFVLLIAAVNLSGLLLARSVGRAREVAVRAALGADRRRLVREALVESGTIGVLSGAVGALVATASIRLLSSIAPEHLGGGGRHLARLGLDAFSTPEADWRVIVFAGALALVSGLLAGLVPAFRSTRGDLLGALKTGARGSTVGVGSLRRPTLLSAIVVAQIACALVLLVAAGLLLRDFHRLRSLDTGMRGAGVLTFRVTPPEGRYGGAAAADLLRRVLERVESVPGVTYATVGRCLPGTGCSSTQLHHASAPGTSRPPTVRRHYVGPDHFRTLGIVLLRGRGLTVDDRAGRPRVAVVNETAARQLWPGKDPIGQRVWFGSGGGFASPDSLTEIVGVVGDVRYGRPGETMQPDFYTSYQQYVLPSTMVMVRTDAEPVTLIPALRRAVAEVDANLPIHEVRPAEAVRAEALAAERFATAALGSFAALGLLLASLGVYGVMGYSVSQRRREIGIRLALGAAPRDVLRRVIGQGAALAGVGVALGALLSFPFTRVLSALAIGVGAADPLVLAGVAAMLLFVALAACWLPARSAARVDPATTLIGD